MVESVTVDRLLPRKPKGGHTAAYKIFNYPFLCRIAQMHLTSEEVLRQTGTVTTGNAEWDRAAACEMVDVPLTIAAMAIYVDEGATIALINPEDTAKIYRLIREHLEAWYHEVQTNLHLMDVPTDDLRKLDALAAYVYPHARYYLTERPFHGRLANTLASLAAARGAPLLQSPDPEAERKRLMRENTPAHHTPLADSIATEAMRRRKAWDTKTRL